MVFCFYKVYILGICNCLVLDCIGLIKICLEKFLICLVYCVKGCNNCGVIICCYCGGGYKCLYC